MPKDIQSQVAPHLTTLGLPNNPTPYQIEKACNEKLNCYIRNFRVNESSIIQARDLLKSYINNARKEWLACLKLPENASYETIENAYNAMEEISNEIREAYILLKVYTRVPKEVCLSTLGVSGSPTLENIYLSYTEKLQYAKTDNQKEDIKTAYQALREYAEEKRINGLLKLGLKDTENPLPTTIGDLCRNKLQNSDNDAEKQEIINLYEEQIEYITWVLRINLLQHLNIDDNDVHKMTADHPYIYEIYRAYITKIDESNGTVEQYIKDAYDMLIEYEEEQKKQFIFSVKLTEYDSPAKIDAEFTRKYNVCRTKDEKSRLIIIYKRVVSYIAFALEQSGSLKLLDLKSGEKEETINLKAYHLSELNTSYRAYFSRRRPDDYYEFSLTYHRAYQKAQMVLIEKAELDQYKKAISELLSNGDSHSFRDLLISRDILNDMATNAEIKQLFTNPANLLSEQKQNPKRDTYILTLLYLNGIDCITAPNFEITTEPVQDEMKSIFTTNAIGLAIYQGNKDLLYYLLQQIDMAVVLDVKLPIFEKKEKYVTAIEYLAIKDQSDILMLILDTYEYRLHIAELNKAIRYAAKYEGYVSLQYLRKYREKHFSFNPFKFFDRYNDDWSEQKDIKMTFLDHLKALPGNLTIFLYDSFNFIYNQSQEILSYIKSTFSFSKRKNTRNDSEHKSVMARNRELSQTNNIVYTPKYDYFSVPGKHNPPNIPNSPWHLKLSPR